MKNVAYRKPLNNVQDWDKLSSCVFRWTKNNQKTVKNGIPMEEKPITTHSTSINTEKESN